MAQLIVAAMLASESARTAAGGCVHHYLSQRLTEDHPKLEAILQDVAHLIERRSFQTAAKRFGEFRLALDRHMRLEEETFFPLLERVAGAEAIVQMKEEHMGIRSMIEATADALSGEDSARIRAAHHQLTEAIDLHTRSETDFLPENVIDCGCNQEELLLKLLRL